MTLYPLLSSLKVEVKSAHLTPISPHETWRLRFMSIKVGKFDVLILGVLLPGRIQLWECTNPAAIRMTSDGKRSSVRGRNIVLEARRRTRRLSVAWNQTILPKLREIANLKYEWDVASEEFKSLSPLLPALSKAEQAYTDPLDFLKHLNIAKRGHFFACLCRLHDESQDSWEVILDPLPGMTSRELKQRKRRKKSNAKYDYLRLNWSSCGGLCLRRVEVKSARMSWNGRDSCWRMIFAAVKPNFFDDLLLAIYLPWGVELWEVAKADVLPRLYTCGRSTKTAGKKLELYASKKFSTLEEAWHCGIKPKLCELATLKSPFHWGRPLLDEAARRSGIQQEWVR